MSRDEKLLEKMRNNPADVSFRELYNFCVRHFGKPRKRGSHAVFKMPWSGDPRINLQSKSGKAKPYQVQQVLDAYEMKEAHDA
ncbi:toxin HicA [Rhodococcus aetherivorans]|uniref:toxin HicA n=1 Tax=Rhodococcus aetherivorans TaxID=191292 RepID=UPI0036714338